MKQFREFLREHAIKIVNFEKKKEMAPLTKTNRRNHMKKEKSATFAKKIINVKLKTIVIILVNTEVLHIAYVI